MNQHLQRLLDFVRQDNNLTPDKKDHLSKELSGLDKEITIAESNHERPNKLKHRWKAFVQEPWLCSARRFRCCPIVISAGQSFVLTAHGDWFNIWEADKESPTSWMTVEYIISPPFIYVKRGRFVWRCSTMRHKVRNHYNILELSSEKLETHLRYLQTIPLFSSPF